MGIVKEPEGVDLYIQSKPLNKKHQKELSEYIAKRKEEIIKRKKKKNTITI